MQSQDEELAKISAELKKVKSSFKKNNVMNLEMEAQEKTLIDISQKLEAKGIKIDEVLILSKRNMNLFIKKKSCLA